MIDNELKNLIIPNLKIHLPEDQWDNIEVMFSECYVTIEEGVKVVTLTPLQEGLALQFDFITGTFFDICDWNDVKTRGILL
ncbi:hypothetical protein [Methanosphaera sp.]